MTLDLALVPTFESIPALPVEWWWKQRMAFGWVHEIVGPGKIGKGRSLLDLVARWTTGQAPPLESEADSAIVNPPGYAIVVLPEDDENEDVRPRLDSAGADPSRVYFLTYLPNGTPFMLPDHKDELTQLVNFLRRRDPDDPNEVLPEDAPDNPVLVYLDPLMQICDKLGTNRQARATVGPVIQMARKTGALVILVNHFTKDGKTTAGSAGLNQVLRCIYNVKMVDPKADPKDGTAPRVLTLEQGNNCAPDDILFTLLDNPAGGEATVHWFTKADEDEKPDEWRPKRTPDGERRTRRSAPKGGPRDWKPREPSDWRRERKQASPASSQGVTVYVATKAVAQPGGGPPVVTPVGAFPSAEDAQEACGKGLTWTPYGDPRRKVVLARGDNATTYAVAPRVAAA